MDMVPKKDIKGKLEQLKTCQTTYKFLYFRTSTSALLPLRNMKFVLSGKIDKHKYGGKIEALGGKVENSVTKNTIALIADKGKTN